MSLNRQTLLVKPCLSCGNLTNRGAYCAHHEPRKARPGSTRRWRNTRASILARDGYSCAECGAPAEHVDHIIPVARGGADHPANLQALCAPCNLRKGPG